MSPPPPQPAPPDPPVDGGKHERVEPRHFCPILENGPRYRRKVEDFSIPDDDATPPATGTRATPGPDAAAESARPPASPLPEFSRDEWERELRLRMGSGLRPATVALVIALFLAAAGAIGFFAFKSRPQKTNPHLADGRFSAAAAALAAGETQRAYDLYSNAAAAWPDHPWVLTLGANIDLARRDHAEAEKKCDRLLAVNPQDSEVQDCKLVAMDLGGRTKEAIALGELMLASTRTPVVIKRRLAYLYARHKDHARAEPLLRELLVDDPGNVTLIESLSLVLWQSGNKAAARTVLTGAIEDFPDNIQLRLQSASRMAANGDNETALKIADAAMEKFAGSAPLHVLRADLLIQSGNHAAALGACRRATELDATDFRPWLLMGMLHQQAERPADAVAAFEKCVALAPADAAVLGSLAREHLSGSAVLARMFADRAVALDAQSAAAWEGMAAVCEATGDRPGADRAKRTAAGLK